MRRTHKLLSLVLGTTLAIGLTTNTQAGTAYWGFDDWTYGSGGETNLVFAGDTTTMLLDDYKQYSQGNGGDPNTNGFLQLTPAVGSRNLAVVFPDIDNGAPIKAFKLTMDVRAGNGTEHPADGFSVSYVREGDPALSNIVSYVDPVTMRGIVFGFAGGDDLATAQSPLGSGLPENGSKTGVAIAFDAWAGNWLPDTSDNRDREGIAVRVDDRTLTQVQLLQWNGDCSNTNSLQTGAWLNNGGQGYDHLEWCKLEVEKTADNKVYVTWKGRKVLDGYQLSNYSTHKGRLILAGRTGGSYQHVHFDNISLQTTPAIEPLLNSFAVKADLRGWELKIEDYLPSQATNVTQVLWNNTDVTSLVSVGKAGTITTIGYTQAGRLPPRSSQEVRATVQTSLGQTVTVIGTTAVMDYFVMPVAYARPLSSVASATRGIALGQPWQTLAINGNSQGNNKLNWTEEQILGLQGPNLLTGAAPTSTDVLDYQNSGPVGTATGNFRVGGSGAGFWDGVDYDIADFGFGSNPAKPNTDDGTIEWFAYVYFPTAGDYYMIVNSDDGFRLTTARHAKDRMGDVISFFNDGRGAGTGLGAGTSQRVIVDQAGVYPIRGIIENQGGGFNVEWYTRVGDNLYLVNNNATPQSLQAWLTATGDGCYVQSAIPVRSAVDVPGNQKISIELGNGTTTVNAGSIVLKVDGTTVTPTITSGSTTKIELNPVGPGNLWPSASSHTIELTFSDSASTAYSYTWNFTVAPYKVLTGGVPLGSQDTSKVGFMYSTVQADPLGSVTFPNRIYVGEQLVQGGWLPNTATLASGPVTNVINFNIATDDQGNFHDANGYPEALIPGIPGTSSLPNEWFACEILTWVEFPTAGFYSLGFNSDDGFWTLSGHARPSDIAGLTITAPSSLAGVKAGLMPAANNGAEVLPTNAVTGQLVLANPVLADTALVNAAQVAGKIAVCYRGVVSFDTKIRNCAAAGAIGVIVVQNRPDANPADGVFPIEMGATTGPIPSTMIRLADGNAITNALASGPVTGTLNAMPNLNAALGYADVGRGATDTIYHMIAPTPGLYPLRTMWWQGGGGGNAEWFSVKNGVKTLLNDLSNPNALKCWYGVNYVPAPTITVGRDGSDIVITYTGTLQSANTVNGTYTDVSGATSPYRSPISAGPKFFRTRQ